MWWARPLRSVDGRMPDKDALAFVIAEVVKAATAPLLLRIAALEAVQVVEGPPGHDGKDADPEFIRAEVAKAVAALPAPVNGRDGKDAPAPDVEAIAKRAAALVPAPKDGEDGQSADPAVIVELVKFHLAEAVAAMPVPKDGRDGLNADPNDVKALIDKAVAALPLPKDGRDGVGVAGAVIGRDGDLVVTLSDGTAKSLGVVIGANGSDGAKGEPGHDGFGFDDFEEDLEDDGRVIVRRYRSGDRVKEFRHKTAWLIYRDVFKPGQSYERGDVVTWGNQSYVCREATTTKPGEGPAWRLMVRKGGDGKVGPQGPAGPMGAKGEIGPQGPRIY